MDSNVAVGRFRPGLMVTVALLHAAAAFGIARVVLYGVQPSVVWWAIVLYVLSSIGVTAGYHRFWTHRAYICSRPLQYLMAVMGALALEGRILQWYKDHQQHHAFTDKPGDPHSPVVRGFWWAHVGWLFHEVVPPPGYRRATFHDLNPVVLWQARWYWPLGIGLGFILPFIATGGDWQAIWVAGFVRVVFHLNVTWSVNSVCHRWGHGARDASGNPIASRDASTDNWIVALLSAGEGWHATHHADPNSYDLGVRPWRYDLGRWFIDFWALFGQVSHRKAFSPP